MKTPKFIRIRGNGEFVLVSFGLERVRETKYKLTSNTNGNIELLRLSGKNISPEAGAGVTRGEATEIVSKASFCDPNDVFVTDSGRIACSHFMGRGSCEESLCCRICRFKKTDTCINACKTIKSERKTTKQLENSKEGEIPTVQYCIKTGKCKKCNLPTTKFGLYPRNADNGNELMCLAEWLKRGLQQPMKGRNFFKKDAEGKWREVSILESLSSVQEVKNGK